MQIRLRTRGRITIPISIRHELGIRTGTRIRFEIEANARRVVLTPITREYVHGLRGKLRGSGALKALMEEKRREANF